MILLAGCSTDDRDSGMLWPVNMRLIVSYYQNVILSAGCSKDDRDSGALWPVNMKLFISNCHVVTLSAGFSEDDRDGGNFMANGSEIVLLVTVST